MTVTHAPPVPLDQPRYGATFGQAIGRFFRKYVAFSGRASRSEFWWAVLFLNVLTMVATVPYCIVAVGYVIASVEAIGAPVGSAAEADALGWSVGLLLSILPVLLVSWATIVGFYALVVRRLHDAGFSGWFALLGLASAFGGGIALYVLCSFPSRLEGLRFEPRAMQPYGQPAYGYQPYGYPSYGLEQYGNQPYELRDYGQQPYEQQTHGRPEAAQPPTG